MSKKNILPNGINPIYSPQHPARQKAIAIMEYIAEYLGKSTIFDCKKGNTTWYDVEDKITTIINKKKRKGDFNGNI